MASDRLLTYIDCRVRKHTGVCLDCDSRAPESKSREELPYKYVPSVCVLGIIHHWPGCSCNSDSEVCPRLSHLSEAPIFLTEQMDYWGKWKLKLVYRIRTPVRDDQQFTGAWRELQEPKLLFYAKLARNACYPETYFPFGKGDGDQPYITTRSTWDLWTHTALIKKGEKIADSESRFAAIVDHRAKPRFPSRGFGISSWASFFLERTSYNFIPTYLERLPSERTPERETPMDTIEAGVEQMDVQ